MDTPVLEARDLRKSYGDTIAVDGVSFSVEKGEVVGLLGPNGAGKTTTINMVLGILEPDAGTIRIDGFDIARERAHALAHTNFAAVYAQLPGNLTVEQNLRIFGMLYNVPDLSRRIRTMLAEFDLERFAQARTGLLSSGESTRVSLAKAMLNNPKLLLFDEPTASLDSSTAQLVRADIKKYAAQSNAGVLWTSHNMYEVTDVCDRILFLSKGRILLQGDPKTLPSQHGKATLEELCIAIAREPLSFEP